MGLFTRGTGGNTDAVSNLTGKENRAADRQKATATPRAARAARQSVKNGIRQPVPARRPI